jgi:glycine cleavage system H protein
MTQTPDDLRYVKEHHWIRVVGLGTIRLGVTDFAQESLGDVVAVGLPRLGSGVQAGYACGEIESTKSVNDLVSPINGTISAVNEAVADQPELTNTDPYGDGWLFEIESSDPTDLEQQLSGLIDAAAYRAFTGK